MVRLAILDREPAVRCGVESIVRRAADIEAVGAAADGRGLWPLLYRADPDVLLVGAPRDDEPLRLSLRVRRRFPGTRVVLYADLVDMAVAARLAGVHAIAPRTGDARELADAVRAAGRGECTLPEPTATEQRRAAARLGGVDRAIVAMRLAGTSSQDIARTVGMPRGQLAGRMTEIVSVLRGGEPRERRDEPAALFAA
jgi:DNA-binding NarL/FixJ family response regulator